MADRDDWVDQEVTKLPPQDLRAEQAALGAVFAEAALAESRRPSYAPAAYLLAHCRREDFSSPVHQDIYQAIADLHRRGTPVDTILVAGELSIGGVLERGGGIEYLRALVGVVATTAHLARYVAVIKKAAVQRQLIRIGTELQEGAEDIDNGLIADVSRRLLEIELTKGGERGQTMAQLCDQHWEWQLQIMEEPRRVEGPRLGLETIDNNIGGLAGWELIIIKAEEKFGKTRLLRQSILATALAGVPVLVYVLEGNSQRWWQGCVAWFANVEGRMLDRGGRALQTEAQNKAILDAIAGLSQLPVYISADHRTVGDIEADILAHWHTDKPQPGAVYVDYLQLITEQKAKGRVEEIKAALDMMLRVNARTGMPVITASQVNRQGITYYSSEAQFGAGLVFEIERGPLGQELTGEQLRSSDEIRLVNTHKRYGPMLKTRELRANWATGRFYDVP